MASFDDLVREVPNEQLRMRLQSAYAQATKGRKFGLVFEEHLPEASPMPAVKIRVGMTVATRAQDRGALFVVKSISGAEACCVAQDGCEYTYPVKELVAVSKFGEPIYPYLEPIDALEHGGGDLWHTLIQADNYHALQLLEYLYPGQVDCIYIDPPYNTGAKDWKYNNDYVDSNDAWRHSKWLSMMEKRLALAKRLLNPNDSVMIVTIDEKEYLHLGMLLEQMFPEARIQMVSSVINPHGANRQNLFARVEEYIYFVFFGNASVAKGLNDMLHPVEEKSARWSGLMRQGASGKRTARPNQFYPIYFSKTDGSFHSVGISLQPDEDRHKVKVPDGCFALFPINSMGEEAIWGLLPESFLEKKRNGFVKFGPWKPGSEYRSINHLQDGMIKAIAEGKVEVLGKDAEGALITGASTKDIRPLTVWNQASHSASEFGSSLLNKFFTDLRFSFPKSLYAVRDAINFAVANKPNALIVDFFAGSGTTLHAVNLLNADDGGHRRCILVTNNEVSEAEAEAFRKRGVNPGDPEWEAKGIAQYVTWPRTTCAIKGVNVKGEALKGEYITSGVRGAPALPMCEGFKANAAFFRLGFLDATSVGLGRRFNGLLPVLWMKAGAQGACPKAVRPLPEDMLVLPENRMAVLFDESAFGAFKKAVRTAKTIDTLFVVTDYDPSYRALVKAFPEKRVYALYRDYLDTFRINAVRMRG